MTRSAEELVELARRRIDRLPPSALDGVLAHGGLVVDIRPRDQRAEQGELDGAVLIERNVLEWRLDPEGAHRIPQVSGHDQRIVVACWEGYASSLAAASLADLGFGNASDLEGGVRAWQAWIRRKVARL